MKLNKENKTNSPLAYQIWGLTGGIASGKSTVAKIFSDFGISVIDADQIARKLSEEGGLAYPEIVREFGTSDKALIREKVFSNPQARKRLEEILHPLIQSESLNQVKELVRQKNATPEQPLPILYEAALLVETKRYKELAGLITVEAPRDLRIKRLLARSSLSQEMAEKMIQSQISDEERRKAADLVIKNTGSLEDLRSIVHSFILKKGWL